MRKLLARFRSDEAGVTAIEYGLIAALVAVAGIGAYESLGGQISSTMTSVGTQMSTASGGATGGGTGGTGGTGG